MCFYSLIFYYDDDDDESDGEKKIACLWLVVVRCTMPIVKEKQMGKRNKEKDEKKMIDTKHTLSRVQTTIRKRRKHNKKNNSR